MGNNLLEIWEIFLAPIYILLIFVFAFFIPSQGDRRIFNLGLGAKVTGGLAFTLIYLFYYGGGDTIVYYKTAIAYCNLILQSPFEGLAITFGNNSIENFSFFTPETGYPVRHIFNDSATLMVSKIAIPFLLLSFKSYLIGSLLISFISYLSIWQLFKLFRHLTSNQQISMLSTLFIPSILFWGSGISKDTITFAATCYFVYGAYWIIIKRKFKLMIVLLSVISLWLIITIKPYIFLVLFPGTLVWIFFNSIQSIKNKFIRIATVPIILVSSIIIIAFTLNSISSVLGEYSTDNIMRKAIVAQEDLKQDYYGGNSFDIGKIEPTTAGVISKFPIATFYGFYGPTLVHVNNVVMLFSALENTVLLLLSFSIFLLRNPVKTLQRLSSEPFLTFCLLFSVLFAFGIGLSSPNFGALVRFKIPLLPFFLIMLLSIFTKTNTDISKP
ncbi:hypothetical protein N8Z47_04515 [Salibacteraceae bacterium]|nr:hypothetical protein [Salibacteraceae bacterium]